LTAKEVFFITPDPPVVKAKKFNEDGEEIPDEDEAEPEDPEEAAKKYAPKF